MVPPHFWLLPLVFALSALGCGGSRPPRDIAVPKQAPAPLSVEAAAPYEQTPDDAFGAADICRTDPDACPSVDLGNNVTASVSVREVPRNESNAQTLTLLSGPLAAAPAASGSEAREAPAEPVATPPPAVAPSERTPRVPEMRDVEARLSVEVTDIKAAADRVRKLIGAAGGQVVNDVVEDTPASYGAAISARIPTPRTEQLLQQVGALGRLLSRKVESQDIGRRYFDAEILLRNLMAALARYEALLEKAENVQDMVVLEANLARLRAQIERVQGDLRWMRDRAARSTVYIALSTTVANQGEIPPEPKLWPGLRALALFDLAGPGSETFLGGGASILGSRAFSIDVDIARSLEVAGSDWFAISMGGDLYSDMLGGGERTFFNPYLGFRTGYVHARGNHEGSLGALLGLELYRGRWLLVDSHVQGLGLFGAKGLGLHAVVQPMLGLYVAF